VLATPLLVRLATAVPPALPAGAVAKLELLVLVLGGRRSDRRVVAD